MKKPVALAALMLATSSLAQPPQKWPDRPFASMPAGYIDLLGKYMDCSCRAMDVLALVSDDPASLVVAEGHAACFRERQALIQGAARMFHKSLAEATDDQGSLEAYGRWAELNRVTRDRDAARAPTTGCW